MFQHIPREYQKEFYVIEHDDFGLADFVQAKDINEFLHVPMMSKITDFLPPVPHRDHWINFWIKKEWLTVICTHSNINSEKYWFLFFFITLCLQNISKLSIFVLKLIWRLYLGVILDDLCLHVFWKQEIKTYKPSECKFLNM